MILKRLLLCFIITQAHENYLCNQIEDHQIFDGSTVYIPGKSIEMETISKSFNCVYKIRTPGNSTGSLYAEVELRNGIRGVNDYIKVIDADGNGDMMNNRTGIGGIPRTFLISPGGEMSIHVVTKFLFMNSKFSITVKYYRASCKIILDSEMFDGNIVYLPGPTLEPLPANFSCTYEIPAPADGLYARVTIIRGLDKPNDKITVIDITGEKIIINSTDVSDSNHPYWYVLPGSVLTMKVTTAIDSMNSSLLISVEYLKANIGPTRIMRADSEINFVDMSTLRDERYDFCSITFLSDERIVLKHAFKGDTVRENPDRFVIDGTFSEQKKVYRLDTLDHWSFFQTKSKAITIVTFIDGFEGFVLNRKSESDKFYFMYAIATDPIYLYPFVMRASTPDAVMATEVVHFEARGILVQNLKIHSAVCKAYIIDGAPNNSSKVIMDFSKPVKMPQILDLRYFSIIGVDCDFEFSISSINT